MMHKPSLPYRIRAMQSRDIPTVAALEQQAFSDPWPLAAYVQELYFNPEAYYFVLELMDLSLAPGHLGRKLTRSELILGYIGLRMENRSAHISTLAVREAWRGRGLGEYLLFKALDKAIRSYEANAAYLEVRASNKVAQALYAKYRFRVQTRLAHYYQDGEDAHMMVAAPLDEAYQEHLQACGEALESRLMEQSVK